MLGIDRDPDLVRTAWPPERREWRGYGSVDVDYNLTTWEILMLVFAGALFVCGGVMLLVVIAS